MSKLNTPDTAFREHQDALGRIAACVVRERVLSRRPPLRVGETHEFGLTVPGILRDRHGGNSGMRLDFQQTVTVVPETIVPGGDPVIEVSMYEYRLLDHVERELLVYHWQPGAAGPDHSHLHVSAFLDVQVNALAHQQVDLDKRHLITGRVEFADFVRMLITEFDVRPLRPDWEKRLAATPQ